MFGELFLVGFGGFLGSKVVEDGILFLLECVDE